MAVNIKNDSFCMSCLSYEMNTFQSLGLWPKFNSCNSSFLLKWLFKLLFKVIELIYILRTFLLYSKYNIFWIVIISSHPLNSWRFRSAGVTYKLSQHLLVVSSEFGLPLTSQTQPTIFARHVVVILDPLWYYI